MVVFSVSPPASMLLHSFSPLSCGRKLLSFSYAQNSSISNPKTAIFPRIHGFPQLGLTPFTQWNGLKHVGAAVFRCQVKRGRKGNRKVEEKRMLLYLGLEHLRFLSLGWLLCWYLDQRALQRWQVARNLGKTVRAFQPTIRELQEVSREFKSTLQKEIGLDDANGPISSSTSLYSTTKPQAADSETTNQSDSPSLENRDAAVNVKPESLQNQSSDADESSKSESPSKEASSSSVTTTPPPNP